MLARKIRTRQACRKVRNSTAEKPDTELYDHKSASYEDENIALLQPEVVNKLMPLLEKGNTGLYNTKSTTEKKDGGLAILLFKKGTKVSNASSPPCFFWVNYFAGFIQQLTVL